VLDGEASPVERKLSFQGGYVEKLDRILSEAYWAEHQSQSSSGGDKVKS
jgi:hypothetical protein